LVDQLRSAAAQQRLLVDVQDLTDLLALLPVADHCVFVTTAETDMLMATYGAIKHSATRLRGAGCWVAVSQVIDVASATEMQQRLVATCDRCLNLALTPLACLPWDPTLAGGANPDGLTSVGLGAAPYRQAVQQAAARIDQTDQRRAARARPHDAVQRSVAG
jgi:MinD-like ATPase involved in chromosome partitioning or flagellar assembly